MTRFALAPLLASALLASGCAAFGAIERPDGRSSPPGSCVAPEAALKDVQLYQIYIDSNGRLLDPVSGQPIAAPSVEAARREAVKREAVKAPGPSTARERAARDVAQKRAEDQAEESDERDYVERILQNFSSLKAADPRFRLTIFIHGGLNSFEASTSRVAEIKNAMIEECRYPLFISWDSNWSGNYADHLFFVRRGLQNRALAIASSPFVLVEDVARAIIRVPASTYNGLFAHRFTESEEGAVARSVEQMLEAKRIVLHPPTILSDLDAPGVRTWSDPLWYNPVKLIAAPVIDGFGAGAWDSMLRRTDLVLRKRRDDEYRSGVVPGTAVSYFMDRWRALYGEAPDAERRREPVTLIGHSMGTLIANDIISNYFDVNFDRIVYMAAACPSGHLETVAHYLRSNPDASFFNLSLHPKRDIGERNFWDFLPRGSLLMWIDQTLGDVNSFEDRTAGYLRNIARRAPDIFDYEELRGRVHLTMFGTLSPNPVNHGDFDSYRFWRPEFWLGEDCTDISTGDGSEVPRRPCRPQAMTDRPGAVATMPSINFR